MIELDVATRRKPVAIIDGPPSNYLVLGDFGGSSKGPVAIDRDNFDEALGRMEVHVGTMRFHKLEDFHPDLLCQRLRLFGDLPRATAESQEEKAANPPQQELAPPSLTQPNLEELLRSSSLLERIAEGPDPFHQYVRELGRVYALPKQSDHTARDNALGERMRAVLHHPEFQAIESAWRGVDFLVSHIDQDGGTSSGDSDGGRVFLAQYSREDANRDLLGLSMAPASLHVTRIQELLNARRWRAIAGLYEFGTDASDIELLGRLALLAAQVRAPLVSACSLAGDFADWGPNWSELAAMPEAGHIGLVLPRFLLRLPYGADTAPIYSFPFEEMPGVPVHSRYLWGNPALACLSLLARGDGALDLTDLPLHAYRKDGEWTSTPCAEVRITEGQELALIEAGLMPLVAFAKSGGARLAGFRAINGKELPVG